MTITKHIPTHGFSVMLWLPATLMVEPVEDDAHQPKYRIINRRVLTYKKHSMFSFANKSDWESWCQSTVDFSVHNEQLKININLDTTHQTTRRMSLSEALLIAQIVCECVVNSADEQMSKVGIGMGVSSESRILSKFREEVKTISSGHF